MQGGEKPEDDAGLENNLTPVPSARIHPRRRGQGEKGKTQVLRRGKAREENDTEYW